MIHHKRFHTGVAAAIGLVLVVAVSRPAQAMTLTIGNIEAPIGGQVEFPIVAEKPHELGPIQFRLGYDKNVIEIVDVKTGKTYNGSIMHKSKTPGQLDIFMTSSANEGINDDGPIAVVAAKVIGNENDTSPLTLSSVEAFERDTTAPIYIDVTTSDGTLTVTKAPVPWLLIAAIGGVVLLLGLIVVFRARSGRSGPATASLPHTGAAPACPQCGRPANSGDSFCGGCGQPL